MMRVSMVSLGVTDMDRSKEFYRDTLGLAFAGEASPGEVVMFRAGEITLVLNRPLAKSSPALAGATEVIFQVEAVEAEHQRLSGAGCHFVRTPREVFPGNWAATFTDPDGHLLTILGPK